MSKPIVKSVQGMSLSIVPGIPIQLIPALLKAKAPRYEPSPPITTNASIPRFFNWWIPFSKTSSGNRNIYVASTNNDILLNELAKTWTLHTYSDYDKNKELESQINSLEAKLGETQSIIKVKDNQLAAMNSKIVSLSNELEEIKKDRDKKASDLQSEKKKNEEIEKEKEIKLY